MDSQQTEIFLKLLVPNQKRIFSYIVTLVPNYADAEDITQEVVSLLWKKFSEYTPGTDFVAWSLAVAKYKIYEYYEDRKKARQKLSRETIRILEKESASEAPDYSLHLDAVKQCIQKLESNDFRLIQLRYELDQDVKSIAARFGYSVQSIYKSLSRIHNALLTCVSRRLHLGGCNE